MGLYWQGAGGIPPANRGWAEFKPGKVQVYND